LGRIANHHHLVARQASPEARLAALDGDAHQLGAIASVGAEAAKGKAAPKVAALKLDARAGFQISRRQTKAAAARLEERQRLFDRRLEVIFALRDLVFQILDIGGKDLFALAVSRFATGMFAKGGAQDQRIGHAVELNVRERVLDVKHLGAGALEGP